MRVRAVFVVVAMVAVSMIAPPAGARPDQAQLVPGMTIAESTLSFDATWDTLVAALDDNPNIGVVATLDHAANATTVGLDLGPTREVFFGNPNLGTPIMQASQTAGIDLPQKMLVWEDADRRVFVGYNHPDYLGARHGAGGAPTLATIEGALAAIASVATNSEVIGETRGARLFERRPGLVFVDSDHSADETFDRLVAAIEAGPPNVFFTLEHDQNAANVGLDLAPTKLIVFGNPALGTPLMQESRTIGIDLPQKFLVIENPDGSVQIVYNDPFLVARRHRIRAQGELVNTIADALAGLAGAAAGS